jgi:hypothetical protein
MMLFSGPTETTVRRSYNGSRGKTDYAVRASELADALGDLEEAGAQILLDRYLRSLEEADEENEPNV